jgi:hypothetical protein
VDGLFGGVGYLMIQLHHYDAASWCFAAAAIWASLLFWLSDFMKTQFLAVDCARNRRRLNKPQTNRRYWRELAKFNVLRYGGVLLIAGIGVSAMYYSRWEGEEYELTQLYGRLYPADDTGVKSCPVLPDTINLNLGSVGFREPLSKLPMTIISVGRKSVISLDRGQDGSLVVIADVKDSFGNLVVRLGRDEFRVNPNNYFSVSRPHRSRSELIVVDQKGKTVLHARYNNEHTFSLTASLWAYGTLITISEEQGITDGKNRASDFCIAPLPGDMSTSLINFAANPGVPVEQQ